MEHIVTASIGEVLWDVLSGDRALGGAPANVARHLAQLGCEAHIVSAIGNDPLGAEAKAILSRFGVDVSGIAVLGDKPTGTVDAVLDLSGNASYNFHDDVAWDNIAATTDALALAAKADALNFGSLSQRSDRGREAQTEIIRATPPDCVRVFDINLRAPYVFRHVLDAGFSLATVIKMNHDELRSVTEMFSLPSDPGAAMSALFGKWPHIQHVVVTRGGEGLWWHDGERITRVGAGEASCIVDTIGAGDSITAMIMYGLVRGFAVPCIAQLAIRIASYVCTQRGGMIAFSTDLLDAVKRAGEP